MATENMFMMVFRFTPNPAYKPTENELKEMKKDWGGFIGNLAKTEKLVSTHQLGFEGKQISADKSVQDGMRMDDSQTISGNMIVKAESLDEATDLAKHCPILKMGGSVEVRNINPM